MPALLINSVDAATFGFGLSEAPAWSDLPPRSTPTQPIIGRQGVTVIAAPIEGSRRVTLRGYVTSTSAAGARTNVDSLKLALLAPLVQLTFQDQPTRYITVGLDGFTVAFTGPVFLERKLRVEIQLTAYDPYFYDITPTSVTLNTGTNRMSLGTGIIRPSNTIVGASTNPILTLLNKAGVSMGTLGLTLSTIGGDTLIVDHDARTVKKNGTSVISAISSGDFFAIDPGDITNYGTPFPYITSSSGTGTTDYKKPWR